MPPSSSSASVPPNNNVVGSIAIVKEITMGVEVLIADVFAGSTIATGT